MEIFSIFKNNGHFLILLFITKILYLNYPLQKEDQPLMKIILREKDKYNLKYFYYLYSEIKEIISERKKKRIFGEFLHFFPRFFFELILKTLKKKLLCMKFNINCMKRSF